MIFIKAKDHTMKVNHTVLILFSVLVTASMALGCQATSMIYPPTPTATFTATSTNTPSPLPTSTPTITPEPTVISPLWSDYKPRLLSDIINEVQDLVINDINDDSFWLNGGDPRKAEVMATYTGEFRPMEGLKPMGILTWAKIGFPPTVNGKPLEELFVNEGKFIVEGNEYWMPIQDQLIPFMKDELAPGDEVPLLLVWAGAMKFGGKLEWLFIVNNFPVMK